MEKELKISDNDAVTNNYRKLQANDDQELNSSLDKIVGIDQKLEDDENDKNDENDENDEDEFTPLSFHDMFLFDSASAKRSIKEYITLYRTWLRYEEDRTKYKNDESKRKSFFTNLQSELRKARSDILEKRRLKSDVLNKMSIEEKKQYNEETKFMISKEHESIGQKYDALKHDTTHNPKPKEEDYFGMIKNYREKIAIAEKFLEIQDHILENGYYVAKNIDADTLIEGMDSDAKEIALTKAGTKELRQIVSDLGFKIRYKTIGKKIVKMTYDDYIEIKVFIVAKPNLSIGQILEEILEEIES